MTVFEKEARFPTGGDGTIVDITGDLKAALAESGIKSGQLNVIVPGSTGAITAIEYEPGLIGDLPEFFEKIIPSGRSYRHDETWGDGNGFSHLRAALVGPSLSIPVSGGKLVLGQWQQVVFLEFDNRPRNRKIHINIIGE
ncbi:MAG: YjbQ family protein [Candidatus Krumholzibacteriota bacterium]|nr:YjbQ family protein [Candidatus Krumholzibacteriota bacterium]